ncbi:MAG: hypothetical protein H5T64_13405 [Chloroflexi bacterium]|nr:hypothetical protein [Chloroflexota bacterium]
MMGFTLHAKWHKAGLSPVFYHFTSPENVASILAECALIPNKGYSICRSGEEYVCLADRMTQGLFEFCGNVVFEFNAPSIFSKNSQIVPRDYGLSERDISLYDDFPFFEHEWVAPGSVRFALSDINRAFLLESREFKGPAFQEVQDALEAFKIPYCFVWAFSLPNNISSDTAKYFARLENWQKFQNSYCGVEHFDKRRRRPVGKASARGS